jgi:hypothetical protein
MASLDNDLSVSFKQNGRINVVSQGNYLDQCQRMGIREADRNGICWELCRRWVKLRLNLLPEDSDVYSLFPINQADILELIQTHAAHNQAGVDANYQIGGAQRLGTAKRKWGGLFRLKAKGLKSRAAVIDHLYNDPGLYIYGFYKNGGHAVAFHITDQQIAFFDPNFGEFIMHRADQGAQTFFKAWFSQFWGRYYKKDHTRGDRELTKYGVDPMQQ